MFLTCHVHLQSKENSSNMHIFRGSSSISCNSYTHLSYDMKNLKCMMKMVSDEIQHVCIKVLEEINMRGNSSKEPDHHRT